MIRQRAARRPAQPKVRASPGFGPVHADVARLGAAVRRRGAGPARRGSSGVCSVAARPACTRAGDDRCARDDRAQRAASASSAIHAMCAVARALARASAHRRRPRSRRRARARCARDRAAGGSVRRVLRRSSRGRPSAARAKCASARAMIAERLLDEAEVVLGERAIAVAGGERGVARELELGARGGPVARAPSAPGRSSCA